MSETLLRYNKNGTFAYSVVHSAWQRPTLPGPCGPSTIGAGGLNGRVRDGNAWFPSAVVTKRISGCHLVVAGCNILIDIEEVLFPQNCKRVSKIGISPKAALRPHLIG